MKMNVQKTAVLSMSVREVVVPDIDIEEERVRKTDRYKYFGSVMSNKGGSDEDITKRISKFSNSLSALYPLLKDKYVPLESKKIIFETMLTLVLIYGAESWTFRTKG